MVGCFILFSVKQEDLQKDQEAQAFQQLPIDLHLWQESFSSRSLYILTGIHYLWKTFIGVTSAFQFSVVTSQSVQWDGTHDKKLVLGVHIVKTAKIQVFAF